MNFELIVRGNKWGVQLNVKKIPIICPCCRNYLNEIYEHTGSHYGFVGYVKCDCGERLHLGDSDNIVEYIEIYCRETKVVLDFRDLFKMHNTDFEHLKNKYGYDIYKRHLNKSIELDNLIKDIENHNKKTILPIDTKFPSTVGMKKWLSLMKI